MQALPVIACLLVAAGCGEDAGGGDAVATAPTGGGVVTEPPPEEGDGASPVRQEPGDGQADGGGDEPEAAAVPETCPDVVVTPNSGAGLFDIEVEQITCPDATTVLQGWGEAGFPGDGPEGFVCEQAGENPDGSSRLRCTQTTSGGVLEFTTGS